MWALRLEAPIEWSVLFPVLSLCQQFGIEPSRVDLRRRRLTLWLAERRHAETLAKHLAGLGLPNRLQDAEAGDGSQELLGRLSRRERELLDHLSRGRQLKEAAYRMGITLNSAREYWSRIRTKWQVKTHAEGAALLVTLLHHAEAECCTSQPLDEAV
jgi:DNA-binding CsgD family transcriptional regulator